MQIMTAGKNGLVFTEASNRSLNETALTGNAKSVLLPEGLTQ